MLGYVFGAVSTATTYLSSTSTPSVELIQYSPSSSSRILPLPSARSPSIASPTLASFHDLDEGQYDVIHDVLQHEDLYAVLGVTRARADDSAALRRAYLARSRRCHPDKFPDYHPATLAFQKVSFAYNVLSKPTTRRAYDMNPQRSREYFSDQPPAEDTFDGVLSVVLADFMKGDFEVIRTFLHAVSEINPNLNLHDGTIESVIGTFRKLRSVMLSGRIYARVLRKELLHMHDIQHSLRQLPYLAISARLRLTIKFARIFLSLPIAIDKAIEAQEAEEARREAARPPTPEDAQVSRQRGQLLGSKMTGLLQLLVLALEKSENIL